MNVIGENANMCDDRDTEAESDFGLQRVDTGHNRKPGIDGMRIWTVHSLNQMV